MMALECSSPVMGWTIKGEEEMEQLLSLLPLPTQLDMSGTALDGLSWTATGLSVF